MKALKLGLIINPIAGIGGPTGLKGSDGVETIGEAFSRGGIKRIYERVEIVLSALGSFADKIELHTVRSNGSGTLRETWVDNSGS